MADDTVIPIPKGRQSCPTCGKPASARHQPFCSARCRAVDLGRWLKGTYRIESEEPPEEGSPDSEAG